MASNSLPPIPKDEIKEIYSWREWFNNLGTYVQKAQTGGVPWTITQGGTGANNANDARFNLGFGSIATQNYNNVTITGGAVYYNTITNTPYGSFYDTTTQSASANTPTAITYNNTSFSNSVSVGSPTSRIVIDNPGVYALDFSIQLLNSNTGSVDEVTVWLRVNGTDVADSSSVVSVPAKHGSINGAALMTVLLMYTFTAGDYFELIWNTAGGTTTVAPVPASVTPTMPRSPSIITNVKYFSNA